MVSRIMTAMVVGAQKRMRRKKSNESPKYNGKKTGNLLIYNKLPVKWSRRDLYCPFSALIFNILRGFNFSLTEILTVTS
jgi:hypothetical protein